MKLLWLDTETTGLNKEKCDIVQIAGIVVIDGEEKERFNLFAQPVNWENIEQDALETTGMTIEKLKTFPTPQETYSKFRKILDKYVDKFDKNDKFYIAGHNVQFDLDFCKLLFQKQGDKYFFSYFKHQTVDLMSLATILHTAGLINVKSFKLEDIAELLEIESNKQLHDASVDIDITRKCFCKLVSKYINFGE
jgi:DNA polymerase-3 subunit epsilon